MEQLTVDAFVLRVLVGQLHDFIHVDHLYKHACELC